MYIKAKYPKVGREWYRQGIQGFGSLYGGNQVSDVTEIYNERGLEFINESSFPNKDSNVDPVALFIARVSNDLGTLDNQIGLDNIDLNSSITLLPNAYNNSVLYSVLPTSGLGDFNVVRGGLANKIDSLGNISEVSINEPRIDYSTGTPTILVEPQTTNLVTFSEEFTSWSSGGNPVLSNNQSSPDGGNNAYLFENSSNGDRLQQSLGILDAGTYTQSLFVKNKGGDVRMNFKNNSFGGSNVFLITDGGVVAETPNANRNVEDYGNGWFRISFTFTSNGTNGSFIQFFGDLGAVKDGFYIFGAQLEEQANATSYISTNGAAATRLEDVISVDLTSLAISSITETIDGVEQTPITSIPSTYTIPQGNIDKIVMI